MLPILPSPRHATLVGRERELAMLRDALAAALAGRGAPRADRRGGGHRQDRARRGAAAARRRSGARWCSSGAATTSPRRRPTARGSSSSRASPRDERRCRRCPPPSPRAARSARSPARRRSSRRCATSSPRSPRGARSSSCSTTCTGPTPPASTCCASSPARLAALPLLLLATYRADELTRRHPLYRAPARCSCARRARDAPRPAPPRR